MELSKYEAAKHAVSVANSVDEVKQIKDKAEAIRRYARQTKDFDMANWAAEIRMRAERRLGEMLKEQEMQTGGDARKIATRSHDATEQIPPTLADIGITKSMSSRAQKIADIPEEAFESTIQDYKECNKELTSAAMTKLLKDKRKAELKEKRTVPDDLPDKTERYEIIHGEFQDAEIDPVDIIITDPPYPKEYIGLYGELAEFSRRALKPGGLLVVMCGQSYLPTILSDMARHIDYLWMSAYLLPGGQSVQVFPRKVNTFWKPLLMFSNGKYEGDWYGDVCKSDANDNDKNHHHWGQSESGMLDVIERFSLPLQTVLDPFCGAGTTGVAALKLGRNFIGIDIDAKAINTTRERLNECC